MLIIDAMQRATTANEVCYLLTSYVETLQFCDTRGRLPACVTALPVRGLDDVAARLEGLQAVQVPAAVHLAGSSDSAMMNEAASLFRVALCRLEALRMADGPNFWFDRRAAARPGPALST